MGKSHDFATSTFRKVASTAQHCHKLDKGRIDFSPIDPEVARTDSQEISCS